MVMLSLGLKEYVLLYKITNYYYTVNIIIDGGFIGYS